MPRASRSSSTARGAFALVLFTLVFALWPPAALAGRLHPRLTEQLGTLAPGQATPVIVELVAQVDPAAVAASAASRSRRGRGQAVVDALRDVANRTQPPLLAVLAREQALGNVTRVAPLWIFNGIAVTATEPVIRRLAADPGVWEIRSDDTIPPPLPTPAAATSSTTATEWNVAGIRAPQVWALDPRFNGEGSIVGSFDTGVDVTHPDLALRYRGDHAISWFDPYGEHSEPFDPHGHGTHTTGTAVGGDLGGTGIGVAPGARWIAAKAWNDAGTGLTSAFHQIFQWFLAPGGDAAAAPDVVNGSWALTVTGCVSEFLPDIQALRAAGIFPAFAAGNSGPSAGSVRSPGAYPESFAVGAVDAFDGIAGFSGTGPSSCGGSVKPDVTAPGVSIRSAVPGGYTGFSGTSMATPHVSGAVAVLRSIERRLGVEELEDVLRRGAVDLGSSGPDNTFGGGRLDLFASAEIVRGRAGLPVVTIAAMAAAAEASQAAGEFRVSRTGDTGSALTVRYTVGGTATPGSDYAALSGVVTIPVGAVTAAIPVSPVDDSLGEADETVIVALAADATYVIGTPGSAIVTITSHDTPPDMVVTTLSAPSGGAAGGTVTVHDTTRNQGGGPAAASTTRFYLSRNLFLGVTDIGGRSVPPLAAGASHSGSVALTIPASTDPGTYYLLAKADGDGAIAESQEGNNLASALIRIGPDLAVTAATGPSSVGAGMAVTFADTTTNVGSATAAASITRYYLSSDILLDATDSAMANRAVPTLAPGASSSGSVTFTLPTALAAGTYLVFVVADAGGAVAEAVETNNRRIATLRVGPDLVVSGATGPTTAAPGTTLTFTDTAKNQGGGPAAAVTTRYYLSLDTALDASDVLLGSRAVPALAAGASHTGSAILTIPAGTSSGTYWVAIKVDAGDAVAETHETNNVALRQLQIGADLRVTTLTVPTTVAAGAVVTMSDTTRNQGTTAAAASTTRYYLSLDVILDGADTPLGSRAVPALSSGTSSTGSAAVTIPTATAAGVYYVLAKADADSVVPETVESNNVAAAQMRVGADLVVSSLSGPGTASPGATVTFTDTTTNQGAGAALASTTAYYLSTNTTVDGADTLVASRAVPALAAGAGHSGSVTFTIPAGVGTGNYRILARADDGDVAGDAQLANNVAARQLLIGPDLAITSFTAPTVAAAGLTITLADSTRNQGGVAAGSSTTGFYLSADALLDASDILLGGRAIPALAAGETHSGSVALLVPGGTPTGSYYLFAKADSTSAVTESQEANNTSVRLLRIGPDLVVSSLILPTSVAAGSAMSVSDVTRNQGGAAAGASATGYYLSANTVLGGDDVLLGSRVVPALAAGASHTGPLTLTVPAATTPGTYYVIGRADAAGEVIEALETNNVFVRTLQVAAP
jgi:subtilase family serine protease/subtilisin family serine protease